MEVTEHIAVAEAHHDHADFSAAGGTTHLYAGTASVKKLQIDTDLSSGNDYIDVDGAFKVSETASGASIYTYAPLYGASIYAGTGEFEQYKNLRGTCPRAKQ